MPSPSRKPRPFATLDAAALNNVLGVFTDIDDTLTTDGDITPDALNALHALRAAQVPVYAITGRSTGWSEPFAMDWPVDGIVAENGAVALIREGDRLTVEFAQDERTRQRNAARLRHAALDVQRRVPGARLARDSPGRLADLAVDHGEFAHLDPSQVAAVVAVLQDHGLQATVSSIHVNGWYGEHDKLTGARWILRRCQGRRLDDEMDRWLYVGDSTNDQRMFGEFPLSVGVANLLRFEALLHTWPAFITDGARGAGFAEVARAVLSVRGHSQAVLCPGVGPA